MRPCRGAARLGPGSGGCARWGGLPTGYLQASLRDETAVVMKKAEALVPGLRLLLHPLRRHINSGFQRRIPCDFNSALLKFGRKFRLSDTNGDFD